MSIEKKFSSTDEFTLISEREMRELRHCAGFLRAAQCDLARLNAADYTSRGYIEVRAALEAEAADRQRDYDMEWQALEALQELRASQYVTKPNPIKTPRVRCVHYKLIQRFYAICRERGLDTTKAARARMRHAMETAMNRCVNSRSEISGSEWRMLGDAIKEGRLAW